jgi:hypothetical protein
MAREQVMVCRSAVSFDEMGRTVLLVDVAPDPCAGLSGE